ncbi:BREX-1 system adenine-specific DNA-methyltransferase PglX [Lutibacter flavus]|uniref:site-specific DNA-methyltransferase (adenine-specific) n=1 Tax=Lutibacter flavus TaxID=691689 RepID=A0A238VI27_9FLAO|nr:BREX-1 system adenine-specific DNA-methyltransferase PglX [Lutibacter flavus]SNR33886.1 Methyltransferase domain-containing protein [Lutibacter flavus]
MNTNTLKKFAQEARKKLISQIGAKLELVLTSDSAELREKASQIKKLQEAINASNKEQVIETVAYTWFNRFMALRFMDANDYQPIGIRVVTPKAGYTLPEILDEAKQGNIPDELPVNQRHIYDVLDGKIPSSNSQNEAYKELLIGACNHLNQVFPFLFEKLSDYTELLLPDDLISEFSIVQVIREGMTDEDCKEVEIIGWLYQFYISELNEDLISSKKVYKKNELAPASQLFTPKWIVQYMVDNTLGQLWSEINPTTKVTDTLEFYIKPAYKEQLSTRETKSIEDIKFFEPCVGSGHILSYAFDVFYKMYEEQGYNPTEISELIITKNLYGVDIDQRAAQLASFVLLMKGQQKHRRFLRVVEKKNIQPNISFYQDFEFDNNFKNATALGSLITIETEEAKAYKVDGNSLFGERQAEVKKLYDLLGQRYDVVVTNPPYISSSRMEGGLKQYVEANYPETKSDLFAAFIIRCIELCDEDGFTGFVTPFVWMFIKSYENLRRYLLNKKYLSSLIKPSYTSFFESAIVPLCTFVVRNSVQKGKSTFFDLGYLGTLSEQPIRLKKAFLDENDINVDGKKTQYIQNQIDFLRIPGSPMGYWLNENTISTFSNNLIGDISEPRLGMATADNNLFLRFNWEVSKEKIGFNEKDYKAKWFNYAKGGDFRKWYGNQEYTVNWKNKGEDIRSFTNSQGKVRSHNYNMDYIFKKGITWSALTSSQTSFRTLENSLFDNAGSSLFVKNEKDYLPVLGLLNSNIIEYLLPVISPTLNCQPGTIAKLPGKIDDFGATNLVIDCISIAKDEYNSKELSVLLKQNELIRIKGQDLEETYDLYQHYWKNKFSQLHKNEEELNRQFIGIYGLQGEVKPEVPLKDITILKEETKIINGQLVFQVKEVFAQFMSYAVGCMFGRYSLDKDGLILANQGETLEDYLEKVGISETEVSFLPDDDNIIPILDDEWFEDDIVNRFNEFLKISFGKANFEKNVAYVEECLGKDIRKYFVKDFYADHIKRYKKRPIYWMFSSPKGSFNVLIYMHRYTQDTLNQILNGYLKEYREKLNTHIDNLDHLIESGTSAEQTKASKEKDKLKLVVNELLEYERDVLYPLATERIAIDLDDGVLVNYNKFGEAIKKVAGLNDKTAKKKVRAFDWIDTKEIR